MISFSGRHFEKTVIMQALRWYLAYSLSLHDVEELTFEYGVEVDQKAIIVEQDHRRIKHRVRFMMGFKLFVLAFNVITRIELIAKLIKNQYRFNSPSYCMHSLIP